MRQTVLFVLLSAAIACRSPRTVMIGWDVPAETPDGYKIMVDDKLMRDIPPPPIDASCNCLKVAVQLPSGQHTVSVIAYTGSDLSRRASLVVE
jgi:hypothetical protein